MRTVRSLCFMVAVAVFPYSFSDSAQVQTPMADRPAFGMLAKRSGLTFLEEYKVPGLESELSGIYPHPSDDALYFALANKNPAHRAGQRPMLPVEYRGKLLTVNRHTGQVTRARCFRRTR